MRESVFIPDIYVQDADCPAMLRLVAKIEMETAHLDETARKLRQYMVGSNCSLALLVTPAETHVYMDTFSAASDSIQKIAAVDTAVLIKRRGVFDDGRELERAVMQWLESMARHPGSPLHCIGEAAWFDEHLRPAMVDVEVTVSGPR